VGSTDSRATDAHGLERGFIDSGELNDSFVKIQEAPVSRETPPLFFLARSPGRRGGSENFMRQEEEFIESSGH